MKAPVMIKEIDGSICAPKGFLAAGNYVGIKKNPTKFDLAIIYSEIPAVAGGVFTTNQLKAAPIILSQKRVRKNKKLQAVVINSGNANACTGPKGMIHAKQMTKEVAKGLKIEDKHVGVASTGVIGVPLPIEKVTTGIIGTIAKLSTDASMSVQAIMTTDTFPKSIAVELKIGDKAVRIGGIAKGSGMIHPNMATMLGFITTDIAISYSALQHAINRIVSTSFNMITVDGDSSTNDMVIVLANGMAKNKKINSVDDPNWQIFYKGLSFVCIHLAKLIAQDGEGATKLIEIQVHGAATEEQAQLAARAVCRSPLVKTAVFGHDANWGRIAGALGASGVKVDPKQLSIELGDVLLLKSGTPLPFDESKARKLLEKKVVLIKAKIGKGRGKATAWGCDLTYDYIKINASYRS